MPKLKWKVAPVATGPYRSFETRAWPTAEVEGKFSAKIVCSDEYVPSRVRTGDHGMLTVYVAQHYHSEADRKRFGGFRLRKLKKQCATLDEAKDLAQRFFAEHPEFLEPVRGPDGQFDA